MDNCIIGETYTLEGVFTTKIGETGNYMTSITTFPSGQTLIIGTDYQIYDDIKNEIEENDIFTYKIYVKDDDYPDFANLVLKKGINVELIDNFSGKLKNLNLEEYIQAAVFNSESDLLKKLGLYLFTQDLGNKKDIIKPKYANKKHIQQKITIKLGIDLPIGIIAKGFAKAKKEPFTLSSKDGLNISGFRFDLGENFVYYPEDISFEKEIGKTVYWKESNPLNPMGKISFFNIKEDYYAYMEKIKQSVKISNIYNSRNFLVQRSIKNIYTVPYSLAFPCLAGTIDGVLLPLVIQDTSSTTNVEENIEYVRTYKTKTEKGVEIYTIDGEFEVKNTDVYAINLSDLRNLISRNINLPEIPASTSYITIMPPSNSIPQLKEFLGININIIASILYNTGKDYGFLYNLPSNYAILSGRVIWKVRDQALAKGTARNAAKIYYIFPYSKVKLRTMTSSKIYTTTEDEKNNTILLGTQLNVIRQGLDGAVDYESGITPSNSIQSVEQVPVWPKKLQIFTNAHIYKQAYKIASLSITDIYFTNEEALEYYLEKLASVSSGIRRYASGPISNFDIKKLPQDITIQVSFDYLSGTWTAEGIKLKEVELKPSL